MLLPAGTFGKRHPIRCTVCKSRSWPEGKVLELDMLKLNSVKHFAERHMKCGMHVNNLAAANAPAITAHTLQCHGLCVNDADQGNRLYQYREEFMLWAAHSNLQGNAKHDYSYRASEGIWFVKSSQCRERCLSRPGMRPVCEKCLEMGYNHGVIANAKRFARKYHAAQLLAVKLFSSDAEVEELKREIMQTQLYLSGDTQLLDLMKLATTKLQYWVRRSFTCDPDPSPQLKKFVSTVVRPACSIAVTGVREEMVQVIGRYIQVLRGVEGDEEFAINLKVATSALNGLSLQARRFIDKQKRGIHGMAGRRSAESLREQSLIADAALTIALHAGNASLAREFGLACSSVRIHLNALKEHGLPTPSLALNFPEVCSENWLALDQILPRSGEASRCRCVLAFDATYLTSTLSQLELHGQRALVGGQWTPNLMEKAFIPLENIEDTNIKSIQRSSTMMECLVWDPSLRQKLPLSVCSVPIPTSFSGTGATHRGCFFMMELMAKVLSQSAGIVRCLVFDGHGSHQYVRRFMHGQHSGLCVEDIKALEFFGELEFVALPPNPLPRPPGRNADSVGFARVALCLAPLQHRDMPLFMRCEVGVSGFVFLDLMKMCSEQLASKIGAPTGSTFLAGQTVTNIQSCALVGVIMTCTIEPWFQPWRYGSCRLTEMAIEEHFSACRRQSSNSQLSARAFWQAFNLHCERGFNAALELAAFCSGKNVSSLKAAYVKWCNQPGLDSLDLQMEEDELLDRCDPVQPDPEIANECHQVLDAIPREAQFIDPDADEETVPTEHVELALETVPDKEQLKELFEGPASAPQRDGKEHLPATLHEAMQSSGDRFNALWRLILRLRTGRFGIDSRDIPADGDGNVKITLTPESAEVLEKVPSLRKWDVKAPMTRGVPVTPAAADAKVHTASAAGQRPRKASKAVNLHVKKPLLKKKTPSKPEVPVSDYSHASIRKNTRGRAAVQDLVQSMITLDEAVHPESLLFNDQGKCRMTFPGAQGVFKQALVEASPGAFEAMQLGTMFLHFVEYQGWIRMFVRILPN
eukprot:Skav221014  [mRNA]  locus=scaffold2350:235252:241894:- [translate_table: standard]